MKQLLIFVFLLLGAMPFSYAGDFNLNSRRISVQDGLSGNTINEIVQDGQGYIWMATNNGLTRFDGYSAINYTSLSPQSQRRVEARIGRIVYDPAGLLWLRTATYMNACYALNRQCFVDWTGVGDSFRQLNKFLLTKNHGMLFYGYNFGVRCSQYDGKDFQLTDYRQQTGELPSNNVLLLMEDTAGNVWIPTDKGVTRLSADNKLHTLLDGHRIIGAATDAHAAYFLDDEGGSFVIAPQGHQLLASRLPATIGRIGRVNTSFVWQDKWMVFTDDGTYTMNTQSGVWTVMSGEQKVVGGLDQGSCEGWHFISNNSGRLWIYPDKGPLRMLDLLPKAHFTINRGRKFHIACDQEGRLFIATYGNGLFVWNPKTDELRHFTAEQPNPIIRTNYLLYALCDQLGYIWLGSEATGAYCLSVMTGATSNYLLPEPDHQGDWANAVSSVAERVNNNTIVIGTREGGIYQYDREAGTITQLDTRKSNVTSSFVDRDGHLWIGTNGEGLFVDRVQYCREDTAHYLPENKIHDICQDSLGRIWIATRDGGLLMTKMEPGRKLVFSQYLSDEMNESRQKDLELTANGMLWIATNNGIYCTDTRQPHITNGSFKSYNTANGLFPYDEIFTLHYVARDSTLWVGAAGSGAVRCKPGQDGSELMIGQITTRQGLANDNVYSMTEDDYGYIWAATEEGISRINTRNRIVNTYLPSPVLLGNVATENCAIKTRDGMLLFGTNYGLITIMPVADEKRARLVKAQVTDLRVNGTSLVGAENMTLKDGGCLELSHDQNTLTFCFSAFDYSNVQSSVYQYYLEGADRDWLPMTTANHADYARMSPGRYVFHLRTLGSNNEWQQPTSLTIVISPPWYASWWAWLLYLLAAALFAWYVYRNWKDKFDLHQQMKLQRQLMDFRTQLFTNITHEFRTPLAIIKGAVDKLMADSSDRQALQTAQRGTMRMLRLVNQFMEFRKVSTGNLRLQVAEGDIVAFVREIFSDFGPMARQKGIQTTFITFEKSFPMPFDRQIVETIVYNLLSNAIKYTPDRGCVQVRIKKENGTVEDGAALLPTLKIEVEDSGPGISPQQQKAIFQPFMQGLASQGGMGIGLYTSFEMARTHHGSLTYCLVPTVEGATPQLKGSGGSLFTLTLPLSDNTYQADDFVSAEALAPVSDTDDAVRAEEIIRAMQPSALNAHHIAIIEDDTDMMEQLRKEIGIYFNTDCYMNGRIGFEGVKEHIPDLLVCDVMLPDMDGYAIVEQLRRHAPTSTLPIIMLTALDDETHQLRAYKAGADDFMVKPCNFRLLVAKAMQLLKWRASSPNLSKEGEDESAVASSSLKQAGEDRIIETQADKVFLDKLQMLVAQHLSKPDFGVDRLAEMMTMGRTKFYGKVKELTGMSPNKYVMQQRMQKAADLLADGELNVSEVSYRVGIQDPSYFNKCFKAYFGVAPSKYVVKAEP